MNTSGPNHDFLLSQHLVKHCMTLLFQYPYQLPLIRILSRTSSPTSSNILGNLPRNSPSPPCPVSKPFTKPIQRLSTGTSYQSDLAFPLKRSAGSFGVTTASSEPRLRLSRLGRPHG